MTSEKIKVNTRPVAAHYARPGERIVEISTAGGGGLISLELHQGDDGKPYLAIQLYRLDPQVRVTVTHDEAYPPATVEVIKLPEGATE